MVRTIAILFVGIVSISFADIFRRFYDDVPVIMITTYRLCIASIILLVLSEIKGILFKIVCRKDLLLLDLDIKLERTGRNNYVLCPQN